MSFLRRNCDMRSIGTVIIDMDVAHISRYCNTRQFFRYLNLLIQLANSRRIGKLLPYIYLDKLRLSLPNASRRTFPGWKNENA